EPQPQTLPEPAMRAAVAPPRAEQAPVPRVEQALPPRPALLDRAAAPRADVSQLDWAGLQAAVASCTACDLCRTRSHAILGDGDERGEWLFVSAAPSADDDAAGIPLAGERGALMDNMLRATGLNRIHNTYLTPAVKCRPVDAAGRDRAATEEERAACRPFLERQVALMRPRVIVVLDGTHPLAGTPLPHGTVARHGDSAVLAVADPQTLLDTPLAKAQAWQALCLARKTHAGSA
ncbi:MAG TPA: uracil-DNA glycosylase, partial [Burkholderiaceae bacterium]